MGYRQRKIQDLAEKDLERGELLEKRFRDADEKRVFRNAYAFKVSYDYSTLKPYCENIILATDGYADHLDKSRAKLEVAMEDYDPDKDVIVVVGRAFDNLLVGMIVAQKVMEKPKARQSYAIAVYYDYHYSFYQVFLDSSIESYEILTK
jgi:Zn-dependent M32 family carboxypeptidase